VTRSKVITYVVPVWVHSDRAVLVLTVRWATPDQPAEAALDGDAGCRPVRDIRVAGSPLWVNTSTIRNDYGHLAYLTRVMA